MRNKCPISQLFMTPLCSLFFHIKVKSALYLLYLMANLNSAEVHTLHLCFTVKYSTYKKKKESSTQSIRSNGFYNHWVPASLSPCYLRVGHQCTAVFIIGLFNSALLWLSCPCNLSPVFRNHTKSVWTLHGADLSSKWHNRSSGLSHKGCHSELRLPC